MSNYAIRANLRAFMVSLSIVVLAGFFTLIPDSFPVAAIGLMIGNALAILAHRLLFPHRWEEVDRD